MSIVVTTADKLACAQRELKMRNRVYPRWVEQDRMSAGKAAFEIAVMQAIVEDYGAAVEAEEAKERLL
jgi:hypothetical protein